MGTVEVDIERDLKVQCAYVDRLLQGSLRTGRHSRLLRNQMVVFAANVAMGAGENRHWFEPEAICQSIRVLEGLSYRDYTKGPSVFTKGRLRGLEYKHFFQASFMAQNLLNETERDGVSLIYKKLVEHYGSRDAFEGKPLEGADLELIVQALVGDNFEKRAAGRSRGYRHGLTGEHLVFARRPDGNRYLFVSTHAESEEGMLKLAQAGAADFPEVFDLAPDLAE
jgi:hypothetical protein